MLHELTRSTLLATADGGSFWLPAQASTTAADVDSSWALVYWVSLFFFVLVTFLVVYFPLRYRRRSNQEMPEDSPSHSTPLEVFWSVIPTIIVVILFWKAYRTYLDLATPPQDSYEIQVMGQKWNWLFTYPNGYIDGDLHVPAGTPVRLVMSSQDVIHSFYVPAFRVKRDVIPGRITDLWFEATGEGEHDIFCAEYCGTSHSEMGAKLVVHAPDEYDAWLEEASDFLSRMPPAAAGELLYNQRGCKQCHSVDGSVGTAPSFLGKYGSRELLVSGEEVLVDEDYVRKSIYEPMADVVAGYEPVMPTYQGRLKEEEVNAIIAYLKTIGVDAAGGLQ